MRRGKFSAQSPEEINLYMQKSSRETYRQDITSLFSLFFKEKEKITSDTHLAMLKSTYIEKNSDIFFETYWKYLLEIFKKREKALSMIGILSFWFDQSIKELSTLPYISQLFFLYLPDFFTLILNDREAKRQLENVTRQAANKPWYKYISPYVEKKRRKIFSRR